MPSYAATQVLHPIYTTPSLGSIALRKTCEGVKALTSQCTQKRRRRQGYETLPKTGEKTCQGTEAVASKFVNKTSFTSSQVSKHKRHEIRERVKVDESTALLSEKIDRKFRVLETILERDEDPEWSE